MNNLESGENSITYSLNRLLWIFNIVSLPMAPAMGLLTSELKGLAPGDKGLMLIGEF